MSALPKPPSIQQIGLRRHLDDTREQHNSYGYEDFVKLVTAGIDKTNIGRAFNVNRATVAKWLKIHGKESHGKGKHRN